MIDKLDELCNWMRRRHATRVVYAAKSVAGTTHMEIELGHEPAPPERPMNLEELEAYEKQRQKEVEEDLFASSEGYPMGRSTR